MEISPYKTMPTCHDIADFLADYLEGRLSLPRRVAFRIHLLGCRDCRRYLKSYRGTLRALRELRAEQQDLLTAAAQAPPGLVAAILAACQQDSGETG